MKAARGLEYWQVSRRNHVFSCASDVQKGVMVVGSEADIDCYDARVMQRLPCFVNQSSLDKLLEAMKKLMRRRELLLLKLQALLHIGRFGAQCNDRLASKFVFGSYRLEAMYAAMCGTVTQFAMNSAASLDRPTWNAGTRHIT